MYNYQNKITVNTAIPLLSIGGSSIPISNCLAVGVNHRYDWPMQQSYVVSRHKLAPL